MTLVKYVKVSSFNSLLQRVIFLEKKIAQKEASFKKQKYLDFIEGVEIIIDVCCKHVGVDREDALKSEKDSKKSERIRQKDYVNARKLCYYFIDKYYPLISYKKISLKFGNRHHTTIISALSYIGKNMQSDGRLESDVDSINDKLKVLLLKKKVNEKSSI